MSHKVNNNYIHKLTGRTFQQRINELTNIWKSKLILQYIIKLRLKQKFEAQFTFSNRKPVSALGNIAYFAIIEWVCLIICETESINQACVLLKGN